MKFKNLCLFALFCSLAACGQRSDSEYTESRPQGNNQEQSQQTYSNDYKIQITKQSCRHWLGSYPNSSETIIELKNDSVVNFTDFEASYILKNNNGLIVNKGYLNPGRLPPNGSNIVSIKLSDVSCSEIMELNVPEVFHFTKIDGDDIGDEEAAKVLKGIIINFGIAKPQISSNRVLSSEDRSDSTQETMQALFRSDGAWTSESNLDISQNCADIVRQSDKIVSFEKFLKNKYLVDVRVGLNNSLWHTPGQEATANELNSSHADLLADYVVDKNNIQLDFKRSDGVVTRYKYTYEKETNALVLHDMSCLVCKDLKLEEQLIYKILKINGSIREKFCVGNY